MRKIIVSMWISLDGFIAGPNGEMDFVTSLFNDEMGAYESDLVDTADTLMLGRKTYESFAGSWPSVPDKEGVSEGEKEYARKLNSMKKFVFSRTLENAAWNNSEILRETDPAAIEKIKAEEGGDILIYGSASIVQALTNLRLIDEYQLLIHPVLLGSGKPLFKDIKEKIPLKHTETKEFGSGVVGLYYELQK